MDAVVPSGITNPYTDLVLTVMREHGIDTMLMVQEFITKTQFNIDRMFVDEQWNMMNTQQSDELQILTPEMIQRLNFCRIPNLIKKLSHLFPSVNRDKNGEYSGDGVNVLINLVDPIGTTNSNTGKRYPKQVKMTKNAYKELIMETQTESARQVRKYYICLEDLFTKYLLYQRAHEIVNATHQHELLTLENSKLSHKLDCVLKQNDELIIRSSQIIEQNNELKQLSETQTQKLDTLSQILYKETDHKVIDVRANHKKQEVIVLQSRSNAEQCEVLRGQHSYVRHYHSIQHYRHTNRYLDL